ncbi:hypothetical protein EB001_07420 [bacterium]|jgi:hypothetical protein|nr:hypothetical protein [bacterium]
MKYIVDQDNNLYQIKTINILQIIDCLQTALTTNDPEQHYRSIYNALSLSDEIVQLEMRNQTPTKLEKEFTDETT